MYLKGKTTTALRHLASSSAMTAAAMSGRVRKVDQVNLDHSMTQFEGKVCFAEVEMKYQGVKQTLLVATSNVGGSIIDAL